MEGGVVGRASAATASAAASAAQGPGSSSSGSSGHGVGVGPTMTVGGLTSSTQTLAVTSTPRSLSLASISSEGSADSHVVEQEDIVALTTAVRAFKEALGRLKRIFHPERDKTETLRVAAHERLGEVLRILRSILEKYGPIQHNELLASASHLISHVNGFSYEDEKADPTSFLEAIDQLALAFSSRVSEYLMGDIDTSSAFLNCSTASSRTKSCENLVSSDAESTGGGDRASGGGSSGGGGGSGSNSALLEAASMVIKEPEILTQQQIDDYLYRHEQGVEYALHRAKVWSKYAKDVVSYIEKRAQLEMEFSRGLTKLAHTIRPQLKEESFLPFQSIYCTALDQDIENCSNLAATCTLLQTHKFIEPLMARRNEHERSRKSIKDMWHRELKRVTEAVANLKKAKCAYIQRHQELVKAREAAARAENTEAQDKLERKREEAMTKAREAEVTYRTCVSEANERHASLQKVKREVLLQTRELILQCDQTMKAVTVGYFQLQHTVAAPAPIQYQTLCESSRLYEPGSQYMEFVKRLGPTVTPEPLESPFSFESYTPGALHHEYHIGPESHANGSMASTDDLQVVGRLQGGSDTDSVGSSRSAKSMDGSPSASPIAPQRRLHTGLSSGDELDLETDADTEDVAWVNRRQVMSKAADTHAFRKLKTPSRCRECDSYVYFHGYECGECGLACHKKCLETLAIQCGHKRLPRKMTTFGVDLGQHLSETSTPVPHLVLKCVSEIDARGTKIKGIYRVSGVKSRVEKLCQAFENGAHLVDLTDQHPNVIANVLKLYLRQLPEPLLTFRLYPEFIRIAKECPSNGGPESNKAADELRDLVRRLPRHHLQCLAVLMHHLHRVGNNAALNNMPSSNLGIVFGPTLLRTAEGSASLSSLVDTVHQTRAIELLITFANEVFGSSENYLPLTSLVTRSPVEIQIVPATPQPNEGQGSVPGSSVPIPVIQRRTGGREIEISLDDSSTASTPPTQPHTPLHHHPPLKDRKGSELEEDWEWEGEDSLSEVCGELSSPRVPSHGRSMPASAHIVKTSLKNYVGLEGVALHMSSGLHSAHEAVDAVHSRLRKTVSDISSTLRPPISNSPQQFPDSSNPPRRVASEESPRRFAEDRSRRLVNESHKYKPPEDSQRIQFTDETNKSGRNVDELGRRIETTEGSRRTDVAEGKKDTEAATPPRRREDRAPLLHRAQALYKSDSKSSMSETELNMDKAIASVGVAGVGASGLSVGGVSVTGPGIRTEERRKISPLLAHRSALTSGTDSSIDSSDYSFDYDVRLAPTLTTSTPILSSRSSSSCRPEVAMSGGASRELSVSRDPSLDNITSSDSSSQELDSAHATEDSHSSEAADDTDAVHPHTRTLATYTSGYSGSGSSGGESGYVSPYLTNERGSTSGISGTSGSTVTLGPSLLLTRATIAQYDHKRTITTVVAPKSTFDENRVRIQVPAAAAGISSGGVAASRVTGNVVASGNSEASVTVTGAGAQQQSQRDEIEESSQEPESTVIPLSKQSLQKMRESDMPPPRTPLSPDLREDRKPSPNRAPRFV
ncbi:unnamed protein product, partial [Meganyctiphanes norvegica]